MPALLPFPGHLLGELTKDRDWGIGQSTDGPMSDFPLMLTFYVRSLGTLSQKVQIVNTLCFTGHKIFASATQLCHFGTKAYYMQKKKKKVLQ